MFSNTNVTGILAPPSLQATVELRQPTPFMPSICLRSRSCSEGTGSTIYGGGASGATKVLFEVTADMVASRGQCVTTPALFKCVLLCCLVELAGGNRSARWKTSAEISSPTKR